MRARTFAHLHRDTERQKCIVGEAFLTQTNKSEVWIETVTEMSNDLKSPGCFKKNKKKNQHPLHFTFKKR